MIKENGWMAACAAAAVCSFAVTENAHAQTRTTIACSTDQENAVWGYQTYAGLQLLTASSYIGEIKNGSEDTERFDYWFGNHEPETIAAVDRMMALIYYDTMEDAQYRCDCAPDTPSNWVAYVNPGDPDLNVYLCAPFFNVSPASFNTWTVAIVSHELSHFHGTTDQPYGDGRTVNSADAAHGVALDDPTLAVNTSYNYQFFLANEAH